MISDIKFSAGLDQSALAYAAKIPFFQQHSQVQFKPGLNILFGQNGCGKSTLLRMIALILAAEQGGVSTITQSWFRTVAKGFSGIEMAHDGQPILFGNPRHTVGLIGGGFDDDFMEMGLRNTVSKASTGQTTLGRLGQMLAVLLGKGEFPKRIEDRVGNVNDYWRKQYDAAKAAMAASIPKGQQTLVFDEPESGLALHVQRNIFQMFLKAHREGKYQVIAASHSPFALGLPGVNYIEMSDGYLALAEEAVRKLSLQFEVQQVLAEFEQKKSAKAPAAVPPTASPDEPAPAAAPAKKRAPRKTPKSA